MRKGQGHTVEGYVGWETLAIFGKCSLLPITCYCSNEEVLFALLSSLALPAFLTAYVQYNKDDLNPQGVNPLVDFSHQAKGK